MQWGDAGLCFVGTLPFSCLLGFLQWLIVAVGWVRFVHCRSAGGMCDVVLMVVPAPGCDIMSLAGESYTFETSPLEMSCCTSPLLAGCSPGNLCLGWGCPASVVQALLVGRLCVVVVDWLLWSTSGGVWCLYGVGWCFLSLSM